MGNGVFFETHSPGILQKLLLNLNILLRLSAVMTDNFLTLHSAQVDFELGVGAVLFSLEITEAELRGNVTAGVAEVKVILSWKHPVLRILEN